MGPQSSVEDFIKALKEVPKGIAGSVEFLIKSMDPLQGSLIRLCAIPHQFNPDILQVLKPELTASLANEFCDEFAELSIVIVSDRDMQLHDDARDYLFNRWLEADQNNLFSAVSARLKEHYEQISLSATGAEKTAAKHQAIFHYIGANKEEGFTAFEKAFRAARYRFALNDCEALIKLVHEYNLVFDKYQKHWLAYHEGKLDIEFRNWDIAENLFNSILDNETFPELQVRGLFRLGALYSAQRQWQIAISKYSEALSMVRKNPEMQDQEHRILEGLATAYREMNDLEQAETLINESVHLAIENEDLSALASGYNSLGIIHRMRGDAKPAIEYFNKSLECLNEFKEAFRKAQLYNNLGLAYADLTQWEESQHYLESSLDLERKAGDTAGQAKALANLARVYLSQGKEARAFSVAEESADLALQIHDWYHAAVVKRAEARVFRRSKRIDDAKRYYAEAVALFKKAKEFKEAETTEEESEKLEKKIRLPWYAWVAIVIAALFSAFILIFIVLAIIEVF